ncbi:hypothetical protein FH972_022184 [Carpinus fangiana]|uniref:Uncharacterized protein n=1 Tax=Carpinus fangiana TaxID=176857 RepID=A0A5N6KRU9_9ROSI|nr:hypothetical protein FH972_022184 [Carpinus fangiana]
MASKVGQVVTPPVCYPVPRTSSALANLEKHLGLAYYTSPSTCAPSLLSSYPTYLPAPWRKTNRLRPLNRRMATSVLIPNAGQCLETAAAQPQEANPTSATGMKLQRHQSTACSQFCGSVIGIVCAWFSFRLYHLPIARGSGWAWGPRSRGRAFGVGVGSHGYVNESRFAKPKGSDDLEMGPMAAGKNRVTNDSGWAAGSEVHSPLVGQAPTGNSALNNSNFSQPLYARDDRYMRTGSSSETAPVDPSNQPRAF